MPNQQHFGASLGISNADKAWYYLACTEIIHPIAANNLTDMFPPQGWSLSGRAAACRRLFGVVPRCVSRSRSLDLWVAPCPATLSLLALLLLLT